MNYNMDIKKLVRKNILNLSPYRSAREDMNDPDAIFMDANENPFPTGYNRYPDPLQRELKQLIAKEKKIKLNNIFLGNGSDEIIDLLFRAFCNPGKDSVIINPPTYGMYEVCAKINDTKVIKIELTSDFQLDLTKTFETRSQAKMIFICSPNNPTGNRINKDSILQLLANFKGIVIVDEAYIDFAKEDSLLSEIIHYPNLVILQTFSKARAMAGIRLGMAFMDSEIVKILTKIKYPYNISILNQKAAIKVLKDNSSENVIYSIIKQKEWLNEQLSTLSSVVKIWPSHANFLLVKFLKHEEVFQFLKKKGIIVRDRSKEPKCESCLRITVGKSSENQSMMNYLKEFEQINQKYYEKNTISG